MARIALKLGKLSLGFSTIRALSLHVPANLGHIVIKAPGLEFYFKILVMTLFLGLSK